MKQKTNRLIRLIYGAVLSAYTVVIGVLFIIQCLSIYHSAEDNPYSVDSVSAHFAEIELFVWVWFIIFALGFILELFLPKENKKEKIGVPTDVVLAKAKARLPKEAATEAVWQTSDRYKRNRRLAWYISLGVFAATMVGCGVILFLPSYTPNSDKTFYLLHNALVDRLISSLPFMLGGILICVLAAAYETVTIRKESAVFKAATAAFVKQGGKLAKLEQKTLAQKPSRKKAVWTNVVRVAVAAVGVVFVVLGIFNGGMGEMLLKAINICTQCIGLG